MQRCVVLVGGRALDGLGGLSAYRNQPNSECRQVERGSETAGDKLRRREGNSPDHQLRPLSGSSVEKDVELRRQPGGWLGSSRP